MKFSSFLWEWASEWDRLTETEKNIERERERNAEIQREKKEFHEYEETGVSTLVQLSSDWKMLSPSFLMYKNKVMVLEESLRSFPIQKFWNFIMISH